MKTEFFNETQINPLHFFRILFQVSIWQEFTVIKTKTVTNDRLTQNESLLDEKSETEVVKK